MRKKIFCLIMVFVLLFALSACKSDVTSDATTSAVSSETASDTEHTVSGSTESGSDPVTSEDDASSADTGSKTASTASAGTTSKAGSPTKTSSTASKNTTSKTSSTASKTSSTSGGKTIVTNPDAKTSSTSGTRTVNTPMGVKVCDKYEDANMVWYYYDEATRTRYYEDGDVYTMPDPNAKPNYTCSWCGYEKGHVENGVWHNGVCHGVLQGGREPGSLGGIYCEYCGKEMYNGCCHICGLPTFVRTTTERYGKTDYVCPYCGVTVKKNEKGHYCSAR